MPGSDPQFAERLLAWFDRHGRHDLPWQRPATPYRVWLSEIMLQQTQVATVIPYFERFLARFPDLPALADAGQDEVLAHWSGLGYYARARNLHACARACVERHGGELPADLADLQALPGIGRSTAGAIYSLAFGGRAPILDGNVKRVLARTHALAGWPGQSAVARALWRAAEAALPAQRVGDYNQALMDLGAGLCGPRPDCAPCPLGSMCRARAEGGAQDYPGRRPRRERPLRRNWALLLADAEGAILLERRPPSGLWGGLWSLPLFEARESLDAWLERYGLQTGPACALPTLRHAFTHFELDIEPLWMRLDHPEPCVMDGAERVWYNGRCEPGGLATPIRRLLQQAREIESPSDAATLSPRSKT